MLDVSRYYEYFVLLGVYVVYINIFCALGVIYSSKRVNSALITLLTVALINLTMKYAQSEMTPMFKTDLALVQHLWYVVFSVCWLISAYVIYRLHELLEIELGKFAKTIVFASLFAGCFTLVKYISRMHLGIDSDVFNGLYSGMINAVNVTVATLSIGVTLTALVLKFMYYKRTC